MGSQYARDIARIEERTLNMQELLKGMDKKLDGIDHTVDKHEVEIAKLNTKQGIWAATHTSVTLVCAAIAGWFGMNR